MRKSVTWQTIQSDYAEVYRYALRRPGLDRRRIIAFAHSEGTLHVSSLVDRKQIDPIGLVFVGMIAESPKSVIRWQLSSRMASDFLRKVGGKGADLRVDNERISAYCRENGFDAKTCAAFESPTAEWTLPTLTDTMEHREYETMRKQWLSMDDDLPYAHQLAPYRGIFASFGWWKQFMLDDTPVIEHLRNYRGRLVVNYGSIDAATPPSREVPFLDKLKENMGERLQVHVYPGLGHTLGPDPMRGPMDGQTLDGIVASMVDMLHADTKPMQ